MNIRKRIVTLLAVSVFATLLAPLGGAQAARASNPVTAPFSHPMEQDYCSIKGTGTCTSDASADQSGRLTGASTSYVREDRANGVTDTASAFSRGGVTVSFSLPKAGASSVTFTVDALINSASASSSTPYGGAWAEVYFFAYAHSTNNCTSCTVTIDHVIADSALNYGAPASRTNENETFSFVLKSGTGERLKGRVEVLLWLTEWAYAGETTESGGLLPILGAPEGDIEKTAEARGDAVVQKVTAAFGA